MSDVTDEKRFQDGFERHDAEQVSARLRLTYRQRLDWLWQAKMFAQRARLAAEARTAAKAGSCEPNTDGNR